MYDLGEEFNPDLFVIPVVIFNKSRGIYFGYIRESDYKEFLRGRRQGNGIGVKNKRHVFSIKCHQDSKGNLGIAIRGPQEGSRIGAENPNICVIVEPANIEVMTKEALEALKKIRW